jgi:hypothetical protein
VNAKKDEEERLKLEAEENASSAAKKAEERMLQLEVEEFADQIRPVEALRIVSAEAQIRSHASHAMSQVSHEITAEEARIIAEVEARARDEDSRDAAHSPAMHRTGPLGSGLDDDGSDAAVQRTVSHPLMASPTAADDETDGFCFVASSSAVPSASTGRGTKPSSVVEANVSTDTYGFTLSEELAPHYQRYKKKGLSAYQRRVQVGWEDFVTSRSIDVAISDSTSWYPSFALAPVPPRSTALKTLVLRHGIPPEYRGQMWSELVGARAKRATKPATYYTTILKKATRESSASISAEDIEKDLDRTFPENIFFNKMGKERLRNVLLAYSERNPKVGYCQSMNFIVALLLLHLDEEDSFWVMCAIIEDMCPAYFGNMMLGSRIDQYVFESLLKTKHPALKRHLDTLGASLPLLTTPWFLCLFAVALPCETVFRVWDVLFYEGFSAVFRISLALFRMAEPQLMSARSLGQVMGMLKADLLHLYAIDPVVRTLYARAQHSIRT